MSTQVIDAVLRQMEAEGLFRRAAAGDQRATSLFVRLAALRANPNGDPNGWGWLSKSSGETNVDGYAEDALVLGAAPSNLTNVYDFVGGAGAPGARILYGAGPVQRRPSNVWVKPVPLSAEEMAYIGASGGTQPGGGTGNGGTVTPPPPPVKCGYDAGAIDRLTSALVALTNTVAAQGAKLDAIEEHASEADKWAKECAERASVAIDEARQVKAQAQRGFEATLFRQTVTFRPVPEAKK